MRSQEWASLLTPGTIGMDIDLNGAKAALEFMAKACTAPPATATPVALCSSELIQRMVAKNMQPALIKELCQ